MFKEGDHWTVRLDHILQVIGEAETMMEGVSYEEFQKSVPILRAMERIVEIISEASKHIPDNIKAEYPYPWKEVVGMRNIIAHDYAEIDYMALWDTYRDDFPKLKELISEISKKYNE